MQVMNAPSRVPVSVRALLAADRPVFPILAHAGDPTIDQHRARQEELLAANETILAQVDAERREMNSDENRSIDDNSSEFDRLETEIARRERVLAQSALMGSPRGRQTAPDAVAGDEELQLLVAAIEQLPSRCREVMTLRKIDGLSQKEVAARLGIAEHTVEVHSRLGLQKCTEFFRQRGYGRGGRA